MTDASQARSDHETTVLIQNKRGLHARASAKFVTVASGFDAAVRVANEDGTEVGGMSIMGLMMLAAAPGDSIRIRATGAQAADAVRALVALVEAKFHEE
jgi:phosphocarrier protein HPr